MMKPTPLKTIRSFVRRQGRVSNRQQRALDTLWSRYVIPVTPGEPIDWTSHFEREAPLVAEIGFGMGHALAQMAAAQPEFNFVGIEVHRPGVGSLLADIEEQSLSNLRIIHFDAVELFTHVFLPNTFTRIQIFFPDPWPKKRHHKRRLIQAEFTKHLVDKCIDGGIIHCATDWEDYALQILDVLESTPDLVNCQGPKQFSPKPDYRPLTKFEARGQRLGHGVWDICYKKQALTAR
jgi:tRNA (guanine-N7-)-methyltransferase